MRRVALAVVALAVAGASASLAGARVNDAQPRQPVRVDSVWSRPGLRTVHVQLLRGVCANDLRLTTLRQGRSSVRMAFTDHPDDAGAPCPAIAKLECVAVVLRRPLAARRVVDLGTGRLVPRAPKGLPHPQPCPRIALPV